MADWYQTEDPALVRSADGRDVPAALIPPTDRVLPAPATPASPVVGAPQAPAVPGAPAAPLNAASVLAKRDAVLGPSLPIAQSTTTTQSAIPQSVLDPIKQRGTERAAAQADAVTQRGENAAQRGERQAMASATAAYGGYQQAEADRQQAAQRAEIARQSQIAQLAQKDDSIDPDRYVRSMSTGQSIGTMILAVINGAARGMTGKDGNGVIDILNRKIDADIAAQKEQIQSGRIRRGNLISYFQQQGMSEDAAERSAKAMSWAQLEKLTAAEIARLGAGGARDEAKVLAETIKAQREQANDELQLTLGTPRSTTSVVRQAPASGGMTNVQLAAEMKAGRDINQMGASGLTQEEFDKQARDFSEKAAKNDDVVQRTKDVVAALGGRVEETRDSAGNVTGYKVVGDLDVKHIGPQATRYEAAVANLKRADVMGMAREPSASLQDEFAAATEMPFLDKSKAVKLQNILDIALRERKNLGAGYNPQARAAVERGKAGVGVPGDWK